MSLVDVFHSTTPVVIVPTNCPPYSSYNGGAVPTNGAYGYNFEGGTAVTGLTLTDAVCTDDISDCAQIGSLNGCGTIEYSYDNNVCYCYAACPQASNLVPAIDADAAYAVACPSPS